MVAMNVWPTDAADGSVATEARWRKMGRAWTPSGVIAGQGLDMLPSLSGTNLTVRSGACWVDGHYCELPGNQVLTATANGLAVVRFDPAANTADLLYRASVSAPAQDPAGTYELPIAKITGSALADWRPLLGGEQRQFASKAILDAQWASAPIGSHAWTTAEEINWHRSSDRWRAFGAIQRAIIASNVTELTIPYATPGTMVSVAIPTTMAPGYYTVVWSGQTWTQQTFNFHIKKNGTSIVAPAIMVASDYAPFVVQCAVAAVPGDVFAGAASAGTGTGGLRAGSHLIATWQGDFQ